MQFQSGLRLIAGGGALIVGRLRFKISQVSTSFFSKITKGCIQGASRRTFCSYAAAVTWKPSATVLAISTVSGKPLLERCRAHTHVKYAFGARAFLGGWSGAEPSRGDK